MTHDTRFLPKIAGYEHNAAMQSQGPVPVPVPSDYSGAPIRGDARAPSQLYTDTSSPITVPVEAVIRSPDGSAICACNDPTCTPGKHVRMDKRHAMSGVSSAGVPWTEGYAIRCGVRGPWQSGIIVVDLDLKPARVDRFGVHHPEINGIAAFTALVQERGRLEDLDTMMVRTGSGGAHLYYLAGEYRLRTGVDVYRSIGRHGIDIRAERGVVIGPGSDHVSGRPHAVWRDVPLRPIPEWLARDPLLQPPTPRQPHELFHPTAVDITAAEGWRRVLAYREELAGRGVEALAASIQGSGGDAALYRAICQGLFTWELPPYAVKHEIMSVYNVRADPPWEERAIDHKIQWALDHCTDLVAGPWPHGIAERLAAMSGAPWRPGTPEHDTPTPGPTAREIDNGAVKTWDVEPDDEHPVDAPPGTIGVHVPIAKIEAAHLSHIAYTLESSPEWADVFFYDQLAATVRAERPPIAMDAAREGFSDVDETKLLAWLEIARGMTAPPGRVYAAVQAIARRRMRHPIKEWLRSLPRPTAAEGWQTLLRLAGEWFGDHEEIAAESFARTLVAAVRRVLRPGCQVDTILVLYDPRQGAKKSSFVKALFGEKWSLEVTPDVTDERATMVFRGGWGIEIPEMDAFARADAKAFKAFTSRRQDTYRKPYGRAEETLPRRFVMIGTTNDAHMLRDPSGERRFLIVYVNQIIPLDEVFRRRPEVWAAAHAVALRPDKEFPHWFDRDTPLFAALEKRHAAHVTQHPWNGPIWDYVQGKSTVTVEQVFSECIMRGDPAWRSKFSSTKIEHDIANCLRGYGATRVREGSGARRWIWTLPPEIAAAKPTGPAHIRALSPTEGYPLLPANTITAPTGMVIPFGIPMTQGVK